MIFLIQNIRFRNFGFVYENYDLRFTDKSFNKCILGCIEESFLVSLLKYMLNVCLTLIGSYKIPKHGVGIKINGQSVRIHAEWMAHTKDNKWNTVKHHISTLQTRKKKFNKVNKKIKHRIQITSVGETKCHFYFL